MHVLLVPAIVYAALLALFLGWFHRQVAILQGWASISAASPTTQTPTSRLPVVDLQTPQQRMAGHANQACPAALWERHDQAWAEYLRAPLGSPEKANAFALWQELGKLAMRAEGKARYDSLSVGVRP